MIKRGCAFIILVFAALSPCLSEASLMFEETWGYVLQGYEKEFSADTPITDLCYFAADINEYGEIDSTPNRGRIPDEYTGRVHLVAVCDSRSLSHFVLDPKYRLTNKIVRSLAAAAKDFDGLQIDYELVPKRDAKNFLNFLKKLRRAIGKDKQLTICVPARLKTIENDVYDYEAVEPYVDRIFIMAYDQHWSSSAPGPVAGMDWSENIADYALSVLPKEKIIMGMPLYGRTWVNTQYAKAWYNSGINRIMKENGSPDVTRTGDIPHFRFKTEITVTGWYDDKDSLLARCKMLKDKGFPNVGFWRLGMEDRDFWPLLLSDEDE